MENNSEKVSETIKTQKQAAQEKKVLSNLPLQLTSTILTTAVICIKLDFQEERIFFNFVSKTIHKSIRNLFEWSPKVISCSEKSFETSEWSHKRAQKKKAEPKFRMRFQKVPKSLPFLHDTIVDSDEI